jgi:hypothetical protein
MWKHLNYVVLKNVCCRNVSELREELRKAKERLRHKKHVLLGCIRQPGFEVYWPLLREVRSPKGWGD